MRKILVFKHAPFFLQCVTDSTKLSADVLMNIEKSSEMKQWVKPVNSHPLLAKNHNYTHIYVDSYQGKSLHTVIYLTLGEYYS